MPKPPLIRIKKQTPNPILSGAHKRRLGVEIFERVMPTFPVFPELDKGMVKELKNRRTSEGRRK